MVNGLPVTPISCPTSFCGLSCPLTSSGTDSRAFMEGLLCPWHGLCDPPSLMRKPAQRGGATSLGVTQPAVTRAQGRTTKLMIRQGLRGRKEVKVTVKIRAWPPFLIPASQGVSSQDPRAPKAGALPETLSCWQSSLTSSKAQVADPRTERLSHFLRSHSSK